MLHKINRRRTCANSSLTPGGRSQEGLYSFFSRLNWSSLRLRYTGLSKFILLMLLFLYFLITNKEIYKHHVSSFNMMLRTHMAINISKMSCHDRRNPISVFAQFKIRRIPIKQCSACKQKFHLTIK